MARAKKNRISVLNWMGTLLLCAIPGVNLIAVICFLIFGKAPSKKSFALALLLLMILGTIAAVVLLMVFPEQVHCAADWLRTTAAELQPAVTAAP